ncbi:MAG: dephospho-CoA kinase [Planctomycetia bacterium]
MIIIGLVGRIGAGKSTVASRFAAHGAHVVDADRLAHEVLGEGLDRIPPRSHERYQLESPDQMRSTCI